MKWSPKRTSTFFLPTSPLFCSDFHRIKSKKRTEKIHSSHLLKRAGSLPEFLHTFFSMAPAFIPVSTSSNSYSLQDTRGRKKTSGAWYPERIQFFGHLPSQCETGFVTPPTTRNNTQNPELTTSKAILRRRFQSNPCVFLCSTRNRLPLQFSRKQVCQRWQWYKLSAQIS